MLDTLKSLEAEALAQIPNLKTEQEVYDFRNSVLGKNGSLTGVLKGIKDLSAEDKQTVGKVSNELRDRLSAAFESRLAGIAEERVEERLKNEFEDVTVPLPKKDGGHLHPITRALLEVEDTFKRMGFEVLESKEVTTEYLNFDAVNVPATHPARDMQDTFWLEGKGNVLATQTSSMQNVILRSKKAPIRVIIPGRVFRNEDIDATHENTFYQVEGIVVDKGVSMANLKYAIRTMLSDLFGREVSIRLRPGYFPFVEPGVEVDFSCPFCSGDGCKICKKSGWIEFMGAGLIHPNVLREGGLDPDAYTGFAFGFGLNRLVMIKYGIPDMRHFQNADVRFLSQF